MKVDCGWGFDYGRVKYNIELDEGNLADLLDEHGIPVDTRLTVGEKFAVLNNECQAYAKLMRLKAGELSDKQAADLREQIVTHKGLRDAMLDKVSARLKEDGSEEA